MENIFEVDELLALARLDLQQGRVEQALVKAKQLLAGQEISAEALRMAAKLYAQLGLFARAEPLFSRYLEQHPDAIEEKFQLGMVCFDSGQTKRAMEIWEQMLASQPTFPPALFYCAVILSNEGRIAEAKRNLEVLLQTVATDNLYFERAKELLQSIERGVLQQTNTPPAGYNQPNYQA